MVEPNRSFMSNGIVDRRPLYSIPYSGLGQGESIVLSYSHDPDDFVLPPDTSWHGRTLAVIRPEERSLLTGRFIHYVPQWLPVDCSFKAHRTHLINFMDDALNALGDMETEWSIGLVKAPNNRFRITFGFHETRSAVEFKLRLP